ncbi:hypothetical protein EC81_010365 [Bacteroides fragilis]|uniref:hypothetical protein n=1 Tax=Bacteroides fragilis TaxID=817 RepID=UPI000515D9C9|nr:hypothetical protein [Bacteroides fragilis]MDK2380548.1 hypothetical protein [Bacteroides fragilis]QCQ54185.1 hypothetical protein EC81_010365 [Bacteroides fragilis]QLK82614.1 hypothetical protein DBK98_010825 [Bacteroides sp. PHL 2737]QRM97839.1 hypothetical protein GFH35_03580 [Bacteroides xylanisolvens]
MTKHSISCAEYPLILKSASFRFGTFGGTLMYVIYKDEITAEAVQSPLFSYVTFAKVVKIIEKSWHTIKNPAVLSQQGRTRLNWTMKNIGYIEPITK